MLRALFPPPRLLFRALSALRLAPTAAAALPARPLAPPLRHLLLLRALSTEAAPSARAASEARGGVAPKRAAELRLLSVQGVVKFVEEELKIEPDDSEKLVKEKIDGAALLETSVDELCDRYGLSGGAAHTIVRGIAPAVAEVQAAAAEAQSATLTIFPPKKKKSDPNQSRKQTLTPTEFARMFDVLKAPLNIVNSSGSVLSIATSLAVAVEASRRGLFLHASRSYDDDLTSLLGFSTNCATALEIKSTLALAGSEHLCAQFGPLELVNEGHVVELKLSREGEKTLKLAPDGLVVSDRASVVLFNSAKQTPSEAHIIKALENVTTLEAMLANWASVTTDPPEAKAQLRGGLRVVPFLSGDNFNAAVAAECLKQGVGTVRPSGEGFVVKAAQRPV